MPSINMSVRFMPTRVLKTAVFSTLCATLLAPAQAQQSEYIHLLSPTSSYVSAQGVLRFPFAYQSVAPESARSMYQSPTVTDYYDRLKTVVLSHGYSRACLSREMHMVAGKGKQDLKNKEQQWINTFKKAPALYTVLDQVKVQPFATTEGTVDGTIYVLKVPGKQVLETFGFFNDDDRSTTWVLQCGSGR